MKVQYQGWLYFPLRLGQASIPKGDCCRLPTDLEFVPEGGAHKVWFFPLDHRGLASLAAKLPKARTQRLVVGTVLDPGRTEG